MNIVFRLNERPVGHPILVGDRTLSVALLYVMLPAVSFCTATRSNAVKQINTTKGISMATTSSQISCFCYSSLLLTTPNCEGS